MDDLDTAIVASKFFELCFDPPRVADKIKLRDVRVIAQRHDRSTDDVTWAEIAAHGIQCDFHRTVNLRFSIRECKTKN